MTLADILAALLAAGLLHMRGVLGYAGWRWMFLVEVRTSNPQNFSGCLSLYLWISGPIDAHDWACVVYSHACESHTDGRDGPREEGLVH